MSPSTGDGRRRRTTRRGQPTAQPSGVYQAPAAVEHLGESLVVQFAGRDGRSRSYDFGDLPVPGIRAELAAAFAIRVGYTGTLQTQASANNAWQSLRRFVAFLAALPGHRPATLEEITVAHLRRFRLERLATMSEIPVMAEMRRVCRVLMEVPADRLNPETRAWLTTAQLMVTRRASTGVPGYSDEVFGRPPARWSSATHSGPGPSACTSSRGGWRRSCRCPRPSCVTGR
jgi:hypothetical protein